MTKEETILEIEILADKFSKDKQYFVSACLYNICAAISIDKEMMLAMDGMLFLDRTKTKP